MTRSPGPQLEHGHTRIANELLVQLAKRLTHSGAMLAVMLLVIRYSYGFQRKHAKFTLAEISHQLGIDRKNARRAVAALEGLKMLTVTDWPGHHRKVYQVNKDWRQWQ